MTGMSQEEAFEEGPWLLHVDGSSTTQGSRACNVITSPHGEDMEFAIRFSFKASNNEAEYEALVLAMRMAQNVGALHLIAYSYSQLIVRQVKGEYEAKEESMVQYLQQSEELKTKFKSSQLQQIPREDNVKADYLSKLANALEDCKTRCITVHHLSEPRTPLNIQTITLNNDWQTPLVQWLDGGHLPKDRWEAARVKARATRSLIQEGILYKKSFIHPLLRVSPKKRDYMYLKKYTTDVTGPTLEPGCWPTNFASWVFLACNETR
ncbi:UNVERIFIED_CONTAM: Ribonuclease HI [Sesamum latifolium]|uniref:Ribonuclease HI n=1 Tax=Sesamum latifolium TaxID=2727402 RepID=A0AAW2WDS9_9LAMI